MARRRADARKNLKSLSRIPVPTYAIVLPHGVSGWLKSSSSGFMPKLPSICESRRQIRIRSLKLNFLSSSDSFKQAAAIPTASAALEASRIEGASWFSISYACEILSRFSPLCRSHISSWLAIVIWWSEFISYTANQVVAVREEGVQLLSVKAPVRHERQLVDIPR